MTPTLTKGVRVPLWNAGPPDALGDDESRDRPSLDIYLPEPHRATGGAMLIFPGGCYTFLSPKSGEHYGRWLADNGIAGFVVNFRLGSHGYRHPALLADGRQALELVRRRATDWGIDPARVGVIGTSAGGHLAAMLLTGAAFADEPPSQDVARPAVGVLCYAVISMLDPLAHVETRGNFLGDDADKLSEQQRFSAHLRVDRQTPPCFVWHTMTDKEVPAEHSQLFTSALSTYGVPYELHLYGQGAHALALAREEGLFWSNDCIRWLRMSGL